MPPPPTATTPTILTLKQTFLNTQTRLLSQAPEPSRAWRRSNSSNNNNTTASQGEEQQERQGGPNNNNLLGAVPEKALHDALYRLNHTIQQHARRVYAAQATRHVAEQIEALYLDSGGGEQHYRHQRRSDGGGKMRSGQDGGDDGGDDDDDKVIGRDEDDYDEAWRLVGADYTHPAVIAALPPTWDTPREEEATAAPLDAKRYADLTTSLRALATHKADAEARVRQLRRIQALLAPFDAPSHSHSHSNHVLSLQENLVTRDGEVEKELERMRVLLVRVADKVARLRERGGTTGTDQGDDDDEELFGEGEAMIVDDVEVVERRKVQVLLDDMR